MVCGSYVYICFFVPSAHKDSVCAVLMSGSWDILEAFLSKSHRTEASFSSESDMETYPSSGSENNLMGYQKYGAVRPNRNFPKITGIFLLNKLHF